MTTSVAAVLRAPGQIEIEQRTDPVPGDDEVTVAVDECGICGSDLKIYAGRHPVIRPPTVLGHEFHGRVVAQRSSRVEVGADVVVFPAVGCGDCPSCRRGEPHLCAHMEVIGGQRPGGLAQRVNVPAANVLPIPADVPHRQRVLIEPLAVAVHAVERAAVGEGAAVLVVGGGAIGVLVSCVLAARGAESVTIADVSEPRLELARRLGFAVLLVDEARPAASLTAAAREGSLDVAFECVGRAETTQAALAATRPGGSAVLVGIQPAVLTLDGVALQRGERRVIGVQMYTYDDFSTAMELLTRGVVPESDPGLVRRIALSDAPRAFSELAHGQPRALKTVVLPGPPG